MSTSPRDPYGDSTDTDTAGSRVGGTTGRQRTAALIARDPRAEVESDDVRKAVESRADIDSLDMLQMRRRALVKMVAPLKALHGQHGLYDDKRKQMVEALKVRARMSLAEQGLKVTEAMVDAHAYADEQYERFLDQGVADKIRYIELQNELSELDERVRSREFELLAYNSECRLGGLAA